MAPTIKVGDTIPDGTFTYIPYSAELDNHVSSFVVRKLTDIDVFSCRLHVVSVSEVYEHHRIARLIMMDVATKLNVSSDWKGKKVVVFAVPGAFTASLWQILRI